MPVALPLNTHHLTLNEHLHRLSLEIRGPYMMNTGNLAYDLGQLSLSPTGLSH